ncbi:MAG: hypothetical protein OEV33_04755 [Armatimonadota bacterium]|nr:hypothetical protein [Armatimonadota bacterium]
MARDTNPPVRKAEDDLREIPKWARRYAQNRTLAVVAFLVIFAVVSCAFGGLFYLTVWAYVEDKRALSAASMLVLCGFAVWVLWFGLIGGDRIIRSITERLYQGDGGVSVGACAGTGESKCPLLVTFVVVFCALASVGLGLLGFLPIRYMQPISALYVVPFLCYLGPKLRRVGSPFMTLWPALYGIHAILDVAGVPVRFWGDFRALDIFVPMVGYGLIATLAGHLYSRVALRRLRRLAASPESQQEAAE